MLFRKLDNLDRTLRRNGLTALVMTDISLRTANAVGKGLLCHAQLLTEFFEWAHAGIIAALLSCVNSGASGVKK